MKPFASRYLLVAAFSLILAACSNAPVEQATAPAQADAWQQLQQNIASNELATAEDQLAALQAQSPDDARLEQYQRQLAEAYMEQGREALQQGNLDRAAQALGQARSLMPQAPALSHDLNQAIDGARTARQAAAEQQARDVAAKLDAERQEQLRQQRLASERQAAAKAATAPAAVSQPTPVIESKPTARLIDPNAATSIVTMPMLDSQDNENLRRLLDSVAADVVTFRCAVRIEVREAKDYPWVAALLSARIKKLDPSFRPQLSQKIAPQQVPRLLLSPKRN